jgi:hypothetical protein
MVCCCVHNATTVNITNLAIVSVILYKFMKQASSVEPLTKKIVAALTEYALLPVPGSSQPLLSDFLHFEQPTEGITKPLCAKRIADNEQGKRMAS